MNDRKKAIVLILAFGLVCPAILYLSGLRLLGTFGFGLIPLSLICWGLSYLLTGSREREICANLTEEERGQFEEMGRAYGRKFGRRILPVVAIGMAVPCIIHFFTSNAPWDSLIQNQLQVIGVMLGVVFVGSLIGFTAGTKERRRIKEFLHQTEYARRQGYLS